MRKIKKTRPMKNIIIISLLLLFLSACMSSDTANSDTVKQSEIHQKYSVTYDQTAKELEITAQFRFGGSGGTTLQLVDPAYIEYNGKEMRMANNFLQGTYYEMKEQTDFTANHSWEYGDCDKNIFKNNLRLYDAEIINFTSEVSKSKGFTILWKGMPVQENEEISLIIETAENSFFENISTDIQGAREINVSPERLKDIPLGAANFQLKRVIDLPLQEGEHLGGKIYGKYLSKKFAVQIVE